MQFWYAPASPFPHPPKGSTPPQRLDRAFSRTLAAADPTGKLGTKAASTRPTTSFLSPTRDRSEATTASMLERTENPPVPLPTSSNFPVTLRTCGGSRRHEGGVLFARIATCGCIPLSTDFSRHCFLFWACASSHRDRTRKTGLHRQERQETAVCSSRAFTPGEACRDRKDRPTETGMRGGKGRKGRERGEGEEKGTHDKPLLETRSLTTPRRMSWPLKCPFLFPGSGTACLPRLPMNDVWSHAGTKM